MDIRLTNTGKRFNREWIFRHINYTFLAGNHYAITGPNGSGKSTLLQAIAGATLHSEGEIRYSNNTAAENVYRHIAFCAPYLDLIEEMTGLEFLNFHTAFKTSRKSHEDSLKSVGLQTGAGKQIRYYSSGMKQRLKLAQAFFSETPVLLLDEPTSNLDEEGVALYEHLIATETNGRLVIISSNEKHEYASCNDFLSLPAYK